MKNLRFDYLIIVTALCWGRSTGAEVTESETTNVEVSNKSSYDVISNCSVYSGEQLKSYVNDSRNLCSQNNPYRTTTELCRSLGLLSKQLCEIPESSVDVSSFDADNVCKDFPNSSLVTSDVLVNMTNSSEFCLKQCVNESEPKLLSLCLVIRTTVELLNTKAEKVKTSSAAPSVKLAVAEVVAEVKDAASTQLSSSSSSKAPMTKSTKGPVNTEYIDDETDYTISPKFVDIDSKEAENDIDDEMPLPDKEAGKDTTVSKVDPAVRTGPQGTYGIGYPDDGNSHFFVYFLTVVVMCIVGYVLYHNKKKVIALIVEGRQDRRRRPNTNQYRKLDNNLEEVMHSSTNANSEISSKRTNVIY